MLGIFAVLTSVALADTQLYNVTDAPQLPRNPFTSYYTPPFNKQPQEFPGLVSKMDPRPDHGEETYQGTGKMVGRKVMVTGGDSGIGRAAAIAYAREGADIVINYLPEEESDAQEVLELIKAAGQKGIGYPGDLRNETFCQDLIEATVRELGGLDCLVNSAGRQQYVDDFMDLTPDMFDWTLKTNLYALYWLVRAAVPHMPEGSSMVFTTSEEAYNPDGILTDYVMTKGGIESYTKSLAKAMLTRGIRVNAVAPGPFWTPLQVQGGQPQSAIANYGNTSQIGRPGQPAEIASLYVLLATTESSYLTGQIMGATGGDGFP